MAPPKPRRGPVTNAVLEERLDNLSDDFKELKNSVQFYTRSVMGAFITSGVAAAFAWLVSQR